MGTGEVAAAIFFVMGAVGILHSMEQMDKPPHRECTRLRCKWFLACMGFNLMGFSSGSWLLLAPTLLAAPALH